MFVCFIVRVQCLGLGMRHAESDNLKGVCLPLIKTRELSLYCLAFNFLTITIVHSAPLAKNLASVFNYLTNPCIPPSIYVYGYIHTEECNSQTLSKYKLHVLDSKKNLIINNNTE